MYPCLGLYREDSEADLKGASGSSEVLFNEALVYFAYMSNTLGDYFPQT